MKQNITRGLVVAGLIAALTTTALSGPAFATRVCYKDPGKGMVCTKIK